MNRIVALLAGWQGYAAAALLAATIAASGAWGLQNALWGRMVADLKAAHAVEMKAVSDQAVATLAANAKWMQRVAGLLSAIDFKRFQELMNAQAENEKLGADVASGARRLWVRVKIPDGWRRAADDTRTPGVDETVRAELDPKFARSLLGIAGRGDAAIITLNGCLDGWSAVATPPP